MIKFTDILGYATVFAAQIFMAITFITIWVTGSILWKEPNAFILGTEIIMLIYSMAWFNRRYIDLLSSDVGLRGGVGQSPANHTNPSIVRLAGVHSCPRCGG